MYLCEWSKLNSRKDSKGQEINDTKCGKFYEYATDNDYQDTFMILRKERDKIRKE